MVKHTMDELVWLRKQLDGDGDDVVREMVREFAQRLTGPAEQGNAPCLR